MATITELQAECDTIQKFLETTMSESGEEAVQRGNDLIVYLARTSKMLADAKHLYNCKINSDLMKELTKQFESLPVLTSKSINLIVESVARDEKYLVNWLDRLNSTVTHQLDYVRTIISLQKQEKFNNRSLGN